MYEYGIVKSIHDQRMRQYQIEAERAHLIRILTERRGKEHRWVHRLLEELSVQLRQMFRRPQPAS
jgi:hypothetical protein